MTVDESRLKDYSRNFNQKFVLQHLSFGREKGKQGEREMNPSKKEQNFPMDGGCDLELHEQV